MNGPTTKWMQLVCDADICQTTTETNSPGQNRCETEIKEIKKHAAHTCFLISLISLNQNRYAKDFVKSECYSKIYPMRSKGQVHDSECQMGMH